MRQDKQIHIRLPDALKDALTRGMAGEYRTMQSIVVTAIHEYLMARGYLGAEAQAAATAITRAASDAVAKADSA